MVMALYRSKSVKLAYAFDLMDDANDGVLTRRALWRFFRSFLTVLFTLSGAAVIGIKAAGVEMLLDSVALYVCDEVFKYSRSIGVKNGATFDCLADWYTTGGYEIASWLELLDMSKWAKLSTM